MARRNEHERETLRNGTANHLETKIISGLEHKVRQHPSLAGHVELARHYKLTGQPLAAVTQLQDALNLAPENLAVHENLALY